MESLPNYDAWKTASPEDESRRDDNEGGEDEATCCVCNDIEDKDDMTEALDWDGEPTGEYVCEWCKNHPPKLWRRR